MPGAHTAQTPHFHVGGLDRPEGVNIFGDGQAAEFLTEKISCLSAPCADNVMVRFEIGVEPCAIVGWCEGPDQTEVAKEPERAVYGVQGESRHPFPNTLKNGFRIGMINGSGHLAEDLQPLRGNPHTGPVQGLFQQGKPILNFAGKVSHESPHVPQHFQLGIYSDLVTDPAAVRSIIVFNGMKAG